MMRIEARDVIVAVGASRTTSSGLGRQPAGCRRRFHGRWLVPGGMRVRVGIEVLAACVLLVVALLGCKASPSKAVATSNAGSGIGTPSSATTAASRSGPATAPAVPSTEREPEALRFVALNTGGATDDEPLPWIVGLHGLGDRPESFAGLFRQLPFRVHVYVPRAPLPYGSGADWFGVRVGGDVDQLTAAMQRATSQVARLVRDLGKRRQNVGKAIVTGFSQGGMLSFALGVRHPEIVRASLPIGGWLPPPFVAASGLTSAQRQLGPIRAFHGEQDNRVPLAPTLVIVQELSRLGFDVEIRRYRGLGHSISPQLRNDWLAALEQILSAPP